MMKEASNNQNNIITEVKILATFLNIKQGIIGIDGLPGVGKTKCKTNI